MKKKQEQELQSEWNENLNFVELTGIKIKTFISGKHKFKIVLCDEIETRKNIQRTLLWQKFG